MKKTILMLVTCLSCNLLNADASGERYKEGHRAYLNHLITQSEKLMAHFALFDTPESELGRFYVSGKLMAYYESLFFLDEVPIED